MRPFQDRLDAAFNGYRGRLLRFTEDYCEDQLAPDELDALKRRLKQVTSDLWDQMRRMVNELEAAPNPAVTFVQLQARLGTLENHVLTGGPGTLVDRVSELERR